MNEQEKKAILHHEALQKQASQSKNNSGISSVIDDIRHKVVEEPYWLRPEGRATTDDIAPKVRDFYASPAAQESDLSSDTYVRFEENPRMKEGYWFEPKAEPDYDSRSVVQRIQDSADDFFDTKRNENGQEAEQSQGQEAERDIGL